MSNPDQFLGETTTAYNASASAYETGGFGDASPHVRRFMDMLPAGARVLEVGCGIGTDAAVLAQEGFTVTATDISEGMVEHAKRLHPDSGVDFRAGVSMDNLSEFARVLGIDGQLFLGLQEGESQEGAFSAPFDKTKSVFLNIFSEDEILTLLGRSGFAITDRQVYAPKPGQHQFRKGITIARRVS